MERAVPLAPRKARLRLVASLQETLYNTIFMLLSLHIRYTMEAAAGFSSPTMCRSARGDPERGPQSVYGGRGHR